MRSSAAALIAIAALAGCTAEICSRNSDCNTGLVCTVIGRCAVPVDASTGDGGAARDASTGGGMTPAIDAQLPDANVDIETVRP